MNDLFHNVLKWCKCKHVTKYWILIVNWCKFWCENCILNLNFENKWIALPNGTSFESPNIFIRVWQFPWIKVFLALKLFIFICIIFANNENTWKINMIIITREIIHGCILHIHHIFMCKYEATQNICTSTGFANFIAMLYNPKFVSWLFRKSSPCNNQSCLLFHLTLL